MVYKKKDACILLKNVKGMQLVNWLPIWNQFLFKAPALNDFLQSCFTFYTPKFPYFCTSSKFYVIVKVN